MSKKNVKYHVISIIVALSFFMEALDSTIINTAIPAMARSLAADPINLKIALISYLLSLAVFIPISGWLSDKFGAKRIFLVAVFIFTGSSLVCGFSSNLTELVVARFIQGFGGALGLPVGRLLLIKTFGREHMIATMNTVVMVGALGMMLGPMIGGIITDYATWQWIFWINIPVGMVTVILAYFYLPESIPESVPSLDKFGFVLFGSSLAGFTFSLSALSEAGMNNYISFSIMGISIFLMMGYAIHSRHVPNPIVKIDLLRLRTFRVSVSGNLMSRLGFGGMPFLIPLFLQIALGFTSQRSGFLLAPLALGVVLGKPLILRLLRLFGYKYLLILNTWLAGFSILAFAGIGIHTPAYIIGSLSFFYGFILTLQYGAMNSLAYADLTPNDLSAANSIISTLQQIAQSFGVAISALLIHLFASFFSADSTLTAQIFHYTFVALGLLTIASAAVFIPLSKEDGQQMIFVN